MAFPNEALHHEVLRAWNNLGVYSAVQFFIAEGVGSMLAVLITQHFLCFFPLPHGQWVISTDFDSRLDEAAASFGGETSIISRRGIAKPATSSG